jgi:hypothetical protein
MKKYHVRSAMDIYPVLADGLYIREGWVVLYRECTWDKEGSMYDPLGKVHLPVAAIPSSGPWSIVFDEEIEE